MTYLFLGEDNEAKDAKILELKNKILTSFEARQFDFDLLHGFKLEPDVLKKAFLALPVVAPKRLIVLRQINRLTEHNQKIVLEFLAQKLENIYLILEADIAEAEEGFLRKVKPFVKVVLFGRGKEVNVFDMTDHISLKNASGALKILNELLEKGTYPLQIMGGLVWYWGRVRLKISQTSFQKGLQALEETDLNIKRSRLDPQHALEKLVVELVVLQG